jgi:endoglucanase
MKTLTLFIAFLTSSIALFAQSKLSENIRLNQIGFYPEGPKSAFVINSNATKFMLSSQTKKIQYIKET